MVLTKDFGPSAWVSCVAWGERCVDPAGSQPVLGSSPHDPVTFLGVLLMLATVGTVAYLVPARRATRGGPLVALRCK
jgi:hypothetical protein